MALVVDASMTLTWAFEDETTVASQSILERLRGDEAVVPAIWPLEVANALIVGQRRGRMTPVQERRFVQLLRSLRIVVDPTTFDEAFGSVLDLAHDQKLSAYDAAYLDLAIRDGLPLATRDVRLQEAAIRLGVPLIP